MIPRLSGWLLAYCSAAGAGWCHQWVGLLSVEAVLLSAGAGPA